MNNDLPSDSQIVRYVKPSLIQDDCTVDGSDFCLRAKRPDETGLFVNWLQACGPDKDQQLSEIRRLTRLQLRRNGRFAELGMGRVVESVMKELESLRIVHDPLEETDSFEADPSHSQIVGLPPGGSDLAALVGDLIAECVVEMHPAVAIPTGSR